MGSGRFEPRDAGISPGLSAAGPGGESSRAQGIDPANRNSRRSQPTLKSAAEVEPRHLISGEIAGRIEAKVFGPPSPQHFDSLRLDDRQPTGDLFVAIRGTRYDSHRSIPNLLGSGIRGVVAETPPPPEFPLPWFQVDDTRRAHALLEQARWGDPALQLTNFGITGTNGKSSTVRILASILEAAGHKTSWMTTVEQSLAGTSVVSKMTTPDPPELAAAMSRAIAGGTHSLALEVSSHAIVQGRISGIPLAGAAIVNLSRDHLDYHGTREAYREAKLKIVEGLKEEAPVLLPATAEFRGPLPHHRGRVLRHSLVPEALNGEPGGTVRSARFDVEGIEAVLEVLGETIEVRSSLRGRHNLENLLVASTLARAVGIPSADIAQGIEAAPAVRGRLESVPGTEGRVLVDYAHTPDALSSVLEAMREVTSGRLLVVFGCGGDRDRGKRPEMGAAAAQFCDRLYVTSDNPRSEDPAAIIDEVRGGIPQESSTVLEIDRRRAIETALSELGADDVLVIAGKGHETDQLIGSTLYPFDDRQVVLDWLKERGSSSLGSLG